MIFKNDAHLQERLAYWQAALRLQDWDIKAELLPSNRMSQDALGCCTPHRCLGWASIEINEIATMCSGDPCDHESTLVHELLHLHFVASSPGRKKNPEAYDEWERGIQRTAQALVSLDRKTSL